MVSNVFGWSNTSLEGLVTGIDEYHKMELKVAGLEAMGG